MQQRPTKHILTLGALLLAGAITAAPSVAQSVAAPNPPPRAEAGPQDRSPVTLTAEQVAKVKSVLAAYKPASLSVDDAKAIKRALRDAGMRHSTALDAAITAAGFSPERLEALDPRPPRPPAGGDAPGATPPRK
jgi:hypothetical protein